MDSDTDPDDTLPADPEPVNFDAAGSRLPGYSVLGRRESERNVSLLVWQPTAAAAEVSRARLVAEGHVQVQVVPGIVDGKAPKMAA